ncbi:MAG: Uma2 family endonuclease [Thiohalomonadales bacterium]
MSKLERLDYISIDEYLDGEKSAVVRHEYIDGAVYAMVGASTAHNLLAGALSAIFRNHLADADTSCHVFQSDMKVKVENGFYYPDIMIACNDIDLESYYLASPKLIVEVPSKSTEAKDRLEKRVAYQKIPNLQEYVLISQLEFKLEIIRRTESSWMQETYNKDEIVNFKSIGLNVELGKIYQELSPHW